MRFIKTTPKQLHLVTTSTQAFMKEAREKLENPFHDFFSFSSDKKLDVCDLIG